MYYFYRENLGPFKGFVAAHKSREGLVCCLQVSASPAHFFEPLIIRTVTKLAFFFIFHWCQIQLRGFAILGY